MATSTSMITGVDFIAVPTRDYEAAARFYGEVLGLRFRKRWGRMPGGEFDAGPLTIALMQSDAFGQEFSPHSMPIEFQRRRLRGGESRARVARSEVHHRHDRQRRLLAGDLRGPRRQQP